MRWQPEQNWAWLEDNVKGLVSWRKELRPACFAYVCRVGIEEIGLIPLEYDRESSEYRGWWERVYDTHPDGIVLGELMAEIVQGRQF